MSEPLRHPALSATPLSPQALLALLAEWDIPAHTHQHAPVFTVAESAELKQAIAGAHTKNLFLKDKAGALFLFSAEAHAAIDLPALAKALGAKGRFSFGSAELLYEALGVQPGSVTAFALVNDRVQRVRFLLDASLLQAELVNFHPLSNDATTGIAPADLLRFCEKLGRAATVVELGDGGPRIRV